MFLVMMFEVDSALHESDFDAPLGLQGGNNPREDFEIDLWAVSPCNNPSYRHYYVITARTSGHRLAFSGGQTRRGCRRIHVLKTPHSPLDGSGLAGLLSPAKRELCIYKQRRVSQCLKRRQEYSY